MRDARGGNCDKGDARNSSSLFLYISLIVFCKIEKPQKSWYSYDGIPSTLKTYQKSTGRGSQNEAGGKCAFDIGS